jgi:microcystin-dependent protein
MSDPFVAEIRIFPFNFAPKGWAFCDGQLLPISRTLALFSLLGTVYGGDGKSTFALPDMQGNAPHPSRSGSGLFRFTIWVSMAGVNCDPAGQRNAAPHTQFDGAEPARQLDAPGADRTFARSSGGSRISQVPQRTWCKWRLRCWRQPVAACRTTT